MPSSTAIISKSCTSHVWRFMGETLGLTPFNFLRSRYSSYTTLWLQLCVPRTTYLHLLQWVTCSKVNEHQSSHVVVMLHSCLHKYCQSWKSADYAIELWYRVRLSTVWIWHAFTVLAHVMVVQCSVSDRTGPGSIWLLYLLEFQQTWLWKVLVGH